MNKAKYSIFFLLLTGLVWSSCDKKVVYPTTSDTMPPLLSPKLGFIDDYKDSIMFIPYAVYNNGILSISGHTPVSVFGGDSISLTIYAKSTGVYLLSSYNIGIYVSWTSGANNTWFYSSSTDNTCTGTVYLTLLDTVNHIAMGTFNFIGDETYPVPGGVTDTIKNGFFRDIRW